MKRKDGRGRPMKSDKIRVKAVPNDKVDIEKMAQALISIAKSISDKNAAFSQPKGEIMAGLPADSELSYDQCLERRGSSHE